MRGMNLRDLEVFVAVYERRGFSRASLALGTVQSSVSMRIRRLEDERGVRLFERRRRVIEPTPSADALYASAKELIALVKSIERGPR